MSESFPPAQALPLADLVQWQEGAVVSRPLTRTETARIVLFAFDAGHGLSEHSAPFDAWVQVLAGELVLVIGGQRVPARPGELVLMPAQVPHAVEVPVRAKMLLTMLRG